MNTFTLKFFARLREETGVSELQVPVNDVPNVSALTDYLIQLNPHWQAFLNAQLLTAVNMTMVNASTDLKAGDEVALFPPVTGG